MCFISRFGRFHEDFTFKEGTVPLPFCRNRPENHSHNLGKALGERLGLLKTGSLSLSLSLSPLYPFHLSVPFTSLFLSPLYPFHLFISLLLLFFLSLYHSLWRIQWTFSSLFIHILPLVWLDEAGCRPKQLFSTSARIDAVLPK